MFKAIIFDYFGTLSSEVAPVWLKNHFSQDKISELRRDYLALVDRGDMDENKMFADIGKMSEIPPEKMREEWLSTALLHPDMLNLVKELRGRYKLAILSDTASAFFRDVLRADGISNLFDAIIVSSEIHMTKADDGSYETVLELLDVPAEQAIMVDDNPANIARAKKLGITGFIFTNYETLRTDLAGVGVIV